MNTDLRAAGGAARFLLLIAAYFAAHVWLRCALSPTLDLDEAEQVVLAQQLQAGYGTQPPLFTWMQTLLLRALGPGLLPLALLKGALLFASFAMTWLAARRLLPGSSRCEAAAAALLFLPYLVYQSLRDSSHSIVLAAACAWCLWLILRLSERRSWADYAALGVAVAAGCLSKYNFALFLLPAVVATAAVREFRPVLRDPRLLLTAAIAAALMLPHALWMTGHMDAATAESFEKLKAKDFSAVRSMAKLIECLVRFSIVPLVMYTIAFPGLWLPCARGAVRPAGARWLDGFLGAGLAGMVVLMIASRATDLSERWLLPLLFCLPLWLETRVSSATPGGERRFAWCVGFAGVAVALALAGHVWFGPALGSPIRKNIDLAPLVQGAVPPRTILAQNYFLGGNLKLRFPGARVCVPGQFEPGGPLEAPVWVVWQSKSSGFRKRVAAETRVEWAALEAKTVELPYFYSDGSKRVPVSIAAIDRLPQSISAP